MVLAAAFGAADALSALTSGPGSGVAGIWIPGGIGLAGVLLGGLGLWPALVVGGLAAAPAYGPLSAASVPIVLVNALAVAAAAWAVMRLGTNPRLGRMRDVAGFAVGSLASAIPLGALGVATLLALGSTEEGSTGSVVALWILSTATGFVVVGGALTALALRWRDALPARRAAEGIVGIAATAMLSYAVFQADQGALILPLLLVAALSAGRIGPRGAAVTSLVVFGFAAATVIDGGGPFGGESLVGRSLTYQTAILVMAVGLQAIGAIGSAEPGAVPGTPSRALVVVLLAGGGLALGLSEGIVTPELIALVPKAQVTLVGMLMALVVVLGALVGTGVRGHVAAVRAAGPAWWGWTVVAGVAVFGAEELFLLSLSYTEVTRAIVLASVAPVLLLGVGVARREVRAGATALAALVLVLLGFYAVTPGEGWFSGLAAEGVWLGLGSSACTAVLLLALSAARRRAGTGATVAVSFGVAAACAAVLCTALGVLPGPALWGNEVAVGGIVYVAMLGTLVPVLVATWAVSVIGPVRVALFEVLAPPIAVLAALAWGESTVGTWQAAGIVLLLAGLAVGARQHVAAHGPSRI